MIKIQLFTESAIFFSGFYFFVLGSIKMLNPLPFVVHVQRWGLLPPLAAGLGALVFIQIEVAAGIALILRVYLQEVIPLLMGGIATLFCLIHWAIFRGKIHHCGCYSGLYPVPPLVSTAGSIGVLLLLGVGLFGHQEVPRAPIWTIWLIAFGILVTNFVAKRALKRPILELTPLKLGSTWPPPRLQKYEAFDTLSSSALILFLTPKCSQCRQWIFLCNEYLAEGKTTAILGVVSDSTKGDSNWGEDEPPAFPIVSIPSWLFYSLAFTTPLAILVHNHQISKRWIGSVPSQLSNSLSEPE